MAITIAEQLHILVVDDDEDDFFITSEILKEIEQYQCKVVWKATYKSAIEELLSSKFHIVFVDYRLGAKTGDQLIEEAIKKGVDIPIILLTGKGNAVVDKSATEKGAYDYLVKTDISAESLERCIRYALARYQSRHALKKSEQKYRSIFENSKDAMFTLNEQFEVMDINGKGEKVFGTTREKVLSTSILKLFKNSDTLDKVLQMLNEKDELEDVEVELQTHDDVEHLGLLTITREKDEEANSYLQGVFHDITEIKKAEQASFVAEKFESTQRFVKMLAHEVRNPLNNILLSLDSMHGADDETKELYSEIVRRNSLRINELIKQLLESFKTYDMVLKPTPLIKIVQEALIASHDRLMLKGVQLKKDVDSSLLILADEEKLRMAVTNFFMNAIEAMVQDKGILTISSTKKDGSVDLMITDNGCGIDPEHLQRLFEPYFTTKKNGVGLGLSSTMAILRSHNATVDVDSEIGKGTKFVISFLQ